MNDFSQTYKSLAVCVLNIKKQVGICPVWLLKARFPLLTTCITVKQMYICIIKYNPYYGIQNEKIAEKALRNIVRR